MKGEKHTPQLTDIADSGARLNPNWVEWLMGWPVGWTAAAPLPGENWRGWENGHGNYDAPWPGEALPRTTTDWTDIKERIQAIANGQVPRSMVLAWDILTNQGD